MSLIFCDSFDDRPIAAIADRYEAGSSGAAAIVAGRTGNAIELSTGILDQHGSYTHQFGSRQSVYVGVARTANLSTALCSIRYNGTPQIYAQLNSDYTISVIRFDTGSPETILATSSRTVTPDAWFYIELYGKIDPANGAYELRIDGTRWLNATGLNTSSTGDSLANQVRLIYNHDGVDDYRTKVDDFYISDDDTDGGDALIVGFAGPVKIACRTPNAAGASSEWVPLAGANYENVDDAAAVGKDDDTSFVASLTDGVVDLYAHQAFEVVNPTIKAVAVHQWAKKIHALPSTLTPIAYVSSVEYPGDETTLGLTYARAFHAFEKNPATGAAWTRAEVSSAQFGSMLGV